MFWPLEGQNFTDMAKKQINSEYSPNNLCVYTKFESGWVNTF